MSIKVLQDRVLVKLLKEEEKTKGGLYIPQTAKTKTNEAIIIGLGADAFKDLNIGDKVIYDNYAGMLINQLIEGEETPCLILKSDDIVAIVE